MLVSLQFQYKTSTGSWTMFHTFNAAGFSGTPKTNFQYDDAACRCASFHGSVQNSPNQWKQHLLRLLVR